MSVSALGHRWLERSDIFWLRDESSAVSDNLPAPEIIAREIIDDPEAVLEQFRLIEGDLVREDVEEAIDEKKETAPRMAVS